MPHLPIVVIIGRPNVGKSTLFNALAGRRRSIVSAFPGTTRDPVTMRVAAEDLDYLLLDTGGLGGGSKDVAFEKDAAAQSRIALQSADLILFALDARSDLTGSDHTIVDLLRRERKRHVPVIIVATKCDKRGTEEEAVPELQALGIGEQVIPVAAVHMQGIAELEDVIVEQLQKMHFGQETRASSFELRASPPRIAIIGKPNVGKSSVLNALMSEPMRKAAARIVSPIPGTTRDITDTMITAHGKPYVFVDTAGLRRRIHIEGDLEYLSTVQSMHAIEGCDIALLVLDAIEPPSHQDKRLAGHIIAAGKGLIILLNKMDLLTREQKEQCAEEVASAFTFCRYAPLLFVSAVTREGLLKIFPLIDAAHRNRLRRIPVKELREWYLHAVRGVPAKVLASAKHITQAADPPPTFILFVKNPKAVQLSQLRALENRLRTTFAFEGTPVRWVTKKG